MLPFLHWLLNFYCPFLIFLQYNSFKHIMEQQQQNLEQRRKLMQYQKKKEKALEDVEYHNLLTFTLTENKLQRNFRTLVEAIMLTEERLAANEKEIKQMKNNKEQPSNGPTNNEDIEQLKEQIKRLWSRIEGDEREEPRGHEQKEQIEKLSSQKLGSRKNSIHPVEPVKTIEVIQPAKESQKILSKHSLKKMIDPSQHHLPSKKEVTELQVPSKVTSFRRNSSRKPSMRNSTCFNNIQQQINALNEALQRQNAQLQENARQIENNRQIIKECQNHGTSQKYFDDTMNQIQKDILELKGQIRGSMKNLSHRSSKAILEASKNKIQSSKGLFNNQDEIGQNQDQLNKDSSKKSIRRTSNRTGTLNKDEVKEISDKQNKDPNNEKQIQLEPTELNENNFQLMNVEMSTLKLCYQELKDTLQSLRKKCYKNTDNIDTVAEKVKKQQKLRIQGEENLQKQLKQLKKQLSLLDIGRNTEQPKRESVKIDKVKKKTPQSEQSDDNRYSNEYLNDMFHKIYTQIGNLVTEEEFERFKEQDREKHAQHEQQAKKIRGQMKEENQLLKQFLKQHENYIDELREQIENMENKNAEHEKQQDRKNNIQTAKIEELKRSLENLRSDMEFYQSYNNEDKKTDKESNGRNTGQEEDKPVKQNKGDVSQSALNELKKSLTNKIHEQRSHLLGLIKDLQKKLSSKDSQAQEIVNLWDKLSELNLYLARKTDQEDSKKNFAYINKRLQKISAYLAQNEENQDDARIAKSSAWNCLSCDKSLSNYQGKIGRHVVWDQMPLKGLNKAPTLTQGGFPKIDKKA